MNSHLLITAKYLDQCLESSTFGATSCNSLANVKEGDCAFIFSSKESKLVGPIRITSEQFRGDDLTFGVNKLGRPNFPNRIWFSSNESFEIAFVDLIISEVVIARKLFLATVALNKQVHVFPLLEEESDYLRMKLMNFGTPLLSEPNPPLPGLSVLQYGIEQGYNSEAWFEAIILNQHPQMLAEEFLGSNIDFKIFNQMVIGLQNQLDILLVADNQALIVEIKKCNNRDNPYHQLLKYKSLLFNEMRFQELEQVQCLALLEAGNSFLEENPPVGVTTMSFQHNNGLIDFEAHNRT